MSWRVVSPYRPFAPESQAHEQLGPFDWVDALRMLRASVRVSNGVETVAITDVDSPLPVPALLYVTEQRRLMPWILEIALAYLRSADFDRDTVMLSPDLLVFGSLAPWIAPGHFTVLMRSGYPKHPILNGVQVWPVARKKTIVAFYEQALAIGVALPEPYQVWGGDTEPLRQLLQPLEPGLVMRDGKPLARLIEADEILQAFSSAMGHAIDYGRPARRPVRPILDFRYTRKRYMRMYFNTIFGISAEVACAS